MIIVRVALATVGGTYELITPHIGRTISDEHLEQRGEGVGGDLVRTSRGLPEMVVV